jgi:hypothetical protein
LVYVEFREDAQCLGTLVSKKIIESVL